ncbi:unnamed protein product [Rhodiola kirilowii]
MASDAGDDHSDCFEFNAIPIIDIRMLSRSDLQALSISSNSSLGDLNRFDDEVLIPKIDRTVFNESAGSRKQTYSRIRLAPRNSKIESCSNRTRPEIATSADDRVSEENREVIEALKELFADGLSKSEPINDLQNAFSQSLSTSAKDKLQKVEAPDECRGIRKRGRQRRAKPDSAIENAADRNGDEKTVGVAKKKEVENSVD